LIQQSTTHVQLVHSFNVGQHVILIVVIVTFLLLAVHHSAAAAADGGGGIILCVEYQQLLLVLQYTPYRQETELYRIYVCREGASALALAHLVASYV
jgi:hypothetical protein